MGIVKRFKPEPHSRMVDVEIYDFNTRPDLYWSPRWQRPVVGGCGGCNSYVLVESESGPWDVEGKKCILASVNGIGEIRWTISKSDLASALMMENYYLKEKGKEPQPWNGDFYEYLLALRHFGLTPKKEG